MTETPLAELRSIDDQIEWLDDRQVLYGDGSTVWVAAADGTGQPRKFLSQASSPDRAATRPAACGRDGWRREGCAPTRLRRRGARTSRSRSTASASDVAVGGLVSYTVTVTNHGPADATSLKVEHLLPPPDAIFAGPATATNPGQGYGCAMYEDQHRVSCDTSLLPNRGTWTITVNVRAASAPER